MSDEQPVYRVVIEDDADPDLSWLEDESYLTDAVHGPDGEPVPYSEYRDPENHVTYVVRLEELCPRCGVYSLVDVIGGVDFYVPFDDYPQTGVYELDDPRLHSYVRELVNDMLASHAA